MYLVADLHALVGDLASDTDQAGVEERTDLLTAINALPIADRHLLYLTALGLRVADIARAGQVSHSTAARGVRVAFRHLAERMNRP